MNRAIEQQIPLAFSMVLLISSAFGLSLFSNPLYLLSIFISFPEELTVLYVQLI